MVYQLVMVRCKKKKKKNILQTSPCSTFVYAGEQTEHKQTVQKQEVQHAVCAKARREKEVWQSCDNGQDCEGAQRKIQFL